jgi:hypothetical protein
MILRILWLTGLATSLCLAQSMDPSGKPLSWRNYYLDPIEAVQEWTWTKTATTVGIGVSLVALSLPNDAPRYWARTEYQKDGGNRVVDYVNFSAQGFYFAVPVTLYGAGYLSKNMKLQNAAFTSVEAGLWANLLSKTIKFSVGRQRPYGANPTLNGHGDIFKPFSREPMDSFPSGHTTITFAMITPWMVYYPNVGTFSLLGLGVAVGLSRLAVDAHWSTDVLAGALLGSAVGVSFARMHLGKNVQVLPLVAQEAQGAQLSYHF